MNKEHSKVLFRLNGAFNLNDRIFVHFKGKPDLIMVIHYENNVMKLIGLMEGVFILVISLTLGGICYPL